MLCTGAETAAEQISAAVLLRQDQELFNDHIDRYIIVSNVGLLLIFDVFLVQETDREPRGAAGWW
jgi:hypothetical protein